MRINARVFCSVLAVLLSVAPASATAETRYVTHNGSDNLSCSLATPCATILNAVSIASAGDTIAIGKGVFQEWNGILIDKNLTLVGVGSISTRVHGGVSGGVFRIAAGVTVTISDLMIRLGRTDGAGGAINNAGTLTIERVRLWQNDSPQTGGAIFNQGQLILSDSELNNNSAFFGGAIANEGFATITSTRIVSNHGPFGSAAIANRPGHLMVINRSLVLGNDETGIENDGELIVVNSTVAKNDTYGVYNRIGSTASLTHVTVTENGVKQGTGLRADEGGQFTLFNTIVAGNSPVQCVIQLGQSFTATGTLISDSSCPLFPGAGSNLLGVDPKLSQFKDSGSYTPTYALKPDSPAIDAGDPAYCASEDQRGVVRPIDGNGDGVPNCDIGAFEYKPPTEGNVLRRGRILLDGVDVFPAIDRRRVGWDSVREGFEPSREL